MPYLCVLCRAAKRHRPLSPKGARGPHNYAVQQRDVIKLFHHPNAVQEKAAKIVLLATALHHRAHQFIAYLYHLSYGWEQ